MFGSDAAGMTCLDGFGKPSSRMRWAAFGRRDACTTSGRSASGILTFRRRHFGSPSAIAPDRTPAEVQALPRWPA